MSRFLVKLSVVITIFFASLYGAENPFVKAGEYYHINPWILYSIAKVESNNNSSAVNKNRNGTVDVGIMQINSCHFQTLSKYGYSPNDLFDANLNIHVGAWILSGCIAKHGYTVGALSCYNGDKTGRYSKKVIEMYYRETKKYASNEDY